MASWGVVQACNRAERLPGCLPPRKPNQLATVAVPTCHADEAAAGLHGLHDSKLVLWVDPRKAIHLVDLPGRARQRGLAVGRRAALGVHAQGCCLGLQVPHPAAPPAEFCQPHWHNSTASHTPTPKPPLTCAARRSSMAPPISSAPSMMLIPSPRRLLVSTAIACWSPVTILTCSGAAVQCSGAVRCGAVQCSGAAEQRCSGAAVQRCGGAAVHGRA